MEILNRFSAILLTANQQKIACPCGKFSGHSRPAILGIVRFAIRDSMPLSSVTLHQFILRTATGPEFAIVYAPDGICVWCNLTSAALQELRSADLLDSRKAELHSRQQRKEPGKTSEIRETPGK